jgi:hypothetical protein
MKIFGRQVEFATDEEMKNLGLECPLGRKRGVTYINKGFFDKYRNRFTPGTSDREVVADILREPKIKNRDPYRLYTIHA